MFELNTREVSYLALKFSVSVGLFIEKFLFRAEDLRRDGEQEARGGGDQEHVQPVRGHRGLHRTEGRQRHQQR